MANENYWKMSKTKKEGVYRATNRSTSEKRWFLRVRKRDHLGRRVQRVKYVDGTVSLGEVVLERPRMALELQQDLESPGAHPPPSRAPVAQSQLEAPEPNPPETAIDEPTQPHHSTPLWTFCVEVYKEQHGVSPRTWQQRKYKVAGIVHDLGHYNVDELTTPIVNRWVQRLRRDGTPRKNGVRGKPLGPEALNDYIVALRAMYRVAVQTGYVEYVPFNVSVGRVTFESDRETWTPAMRRRLLDVAAESDTGIWRLARFLMLTGCRPIEALRLEWCHVEDVPASRLRVTGKALRRRYLPLTGELGSFVASLERSGGVAVFGVESGPTAGGAFKYWPQKRWERTCAAAEVPSVAYDLRHTFITEMIAAGAPLAKVAKWCGNSVRVIEERYSHLAPHHLSEIADLVERPEGARPGTPSDIHDAVGLPTGAPKG